LQESSQGAIGVTNPSYLTAGLCDLPAGATLLQDDFALSSVDPTFISIPSPGKNFPSKINIYLSNKYQYFKRRIQGGWIVI
jgi:hypothetical protein